MKILFTAFEAEPFVKTGGLGDVAGSLPGAVSSSAFDVRVVLPKLAQIREKYLKKMEFVTSFEV
ncbi:MAG: glycogen/starch synthase, partial [Firmicutes bacterium]|nr:glycogen/starch synthase [Bacillota bacterium]